jgi:hypothetical protein
MVEAQLGSDPRCAIGPAGTSVNGDDELAQSRVFLATCTKGTSTPSVVAARRDAEEPAHAADLVNGLLATDELEDG